ncbi:hypothetical protein BKA93DRAFT_750493 [Sparassis latifolia]
MSLRYTYQKGSQIPTLIASTVSTLNATAFSRRLRGLFYEETFQRRETSATPRRFLTVFWKPGLVNRKLTAKERRPSEYRLDGHASYRAAIDRNGDLPLTNGEDEELLGMRATSGRDAASREGSADESERALALLISDNRLSRLQLETTRRHVTVAHSTRMACRRPGLTRSPEFEGVS